MPARPCPAIAIPMHILTTGICFFCSRSSHRQIVPPPKMPSRCQQSCRYTPEVGVAAIITDYPPSKPLSLCNNRAGTLPRRWGVIAIITFCPSQKPPLTVPTIVQVHSRGGGRYRNHYALHRAGPLPAVAPKKGHPQLRKGGGAAGPGERGLFSGPRSRHCFVFVRARTPPRQSGL